MPYYTKFEIHAIGNIAKSKFLTLLRKKELLSVKDCGEYMKLPVKFLPFSGQIKDGRTEWGYNDDDAEEVEACLIEAGCSYNRATVLIQSDYEKERDRLQAEDEKALLQTAKEIRWYLVAGYTDEQIVEILRRIKTPLAFAHPFAGA